MPILTCLTALLGIKHPILLAPMNPIPVVSNRYRLAHP
jgi:hypothetical protein